MPIYGVPVCEFEHAHWSYYSKQHSDHTLLQSFIDEFIDESKASGAGG